MPAVPLQSPIHLADGLPPISSSPSSRRRSQVAAARRTRLGRPGACIASHPHAFDDLPWISTLDAAPEYTNPWDIADLSLIPIASFSDSSPSGPGPIRSRKSSSPRSNPIIPSTSSPSSLPIRDTSLLSPSSVSTPRSKFLPSRVLFRNLMPVPCDPSSFVSSLRS